MKYFFSMNDPETILLIDSWKDQKSIDAHHATIMMEQITELRNKIRSSYEGRTLYF